MARMIPTVISPTTKSPAEKKIFKWFRDAEGTEDWVVFHSLGIAEHQTLIEGEVDFLVVAPKYGLFAIEVKGGRVKRENGMWHFTNKRGETTVKPRGPFEQADEAMFSIMEAIKEKADAEHYRVGNLLYGHGVMVPDIEYGVMGIDEEPWQVFDCNDDDNVVDFIKRLSKGAKERWEQTYGKFYPDKLPTPQDAKYLLSILRSDFDKVIAIRARINNAEQELLELTEKQYKCLDQIEENKRAIVHGPAGTGKTLLAIEQAKKSVANEKKVALFCYNSSIATWFNTYFDEEASELKPAFVGTFHKFMTDVLKDNEVKYTIPSDEVEKEVFYREILPAKTVETLLEKPLEYDEIIIDEAQDLVADNYIDVMDLIIKKGFERGSWKLFGDFSRQAIYSDDVSSDDIFERLEDRTAFIRYKLRDNCRNTKQICEDIQTITGYEAPKDLWSKVEGMPVDHRICGSEDEEIEEINKLLDLLDEKGIDPGKITILSPRTKDNSIVSKLGRKIADYSFKDESKVSFSTIQSFKGLENAVIILTDVGSYSAVKLMYVALSRARACLYIFENKGAHAEYTELLKRRLLNG